MTAQASRADVRGRAHAPALLDSVHLELLSLRAGGHTVTSAAARLRCTPNTLYVHAAECLRRLRVPNLEAAIHVCFLAELLPRPDLAEFSLDLGREDLELWRQLAGGATNERLSRVLDRSVSTITLRIKELRQATLSATRPHLVARGWSHGVLHDSLVRMSDGRTLLLPPACPAGDGAPFRWANTGPVPAGRAT
ncbi:hypothetical protein ACFYVL_08825 [Streptomyces sp. NPDC004111]|uniref:hypothetical protein n=1 Tax=Streptomyces sp. NPDC004111 TaxID=3364690 RepID=UPI0036CCD9B2